MTLKQTVVDGCIYRLQIRGCRVDFTKASRGSVRVFNGVTSEHFQGFDFAVFVLGREGYDIINEKNESNCTCFSRSFRRFYYLIIHNTTMWSLDFFRKLNKKTPQSSFIQLLIISNLPLPILCIFPAEITIVSKPEWSGRWLLKLVPIKGGKKVAYFNPPGLARTISLKK